MQSAIAMLRGFSGKPSHPPLTDATIGAYTIGVVMLVLGALGLEEPAMAHGAAIAVAGGVVLAIPTALTGLLDWLAIPAGTPARTVATIHLGAMLTATVLFAATFLAQLDGYRGGQITVLALVLGLVAEVALIAGGFVGGSLVFVYGVRVVGRGDTPIADALIPGRIEHPDSASGTAPHRAPGASARPEGSYPVASNPRRQP